MVIKHVERRVRLSDSHIKKLRAKDKLFSVGDSEVPGLRIYVETSCRLSIYAGIRHRLFSEKVAKFSS